MSENKIPDRLYIDFTDKQIVERLENENYFNFSNKSRKEQFMFAMSIGVKNEIEFTKIQKKHEWFFVKDIKTEDLALMKACSIHKEKNIHVLENLAEIYRISEEYAHSGFIVLDGMVNSSSLSSFEKKYEVEINEMYNKIEFQ